MKFVIPSYKRCEKVKSETLAFLERHNVPLDDIWLVVRDDDPELEEYGKIKVNHLVLEEKGIGKTHNGITNFFDEGEQLIEIDDDLIDLCDKERKPIENFLEVCDTIFQKLDEEKLSYCGTYSVNNPMFMSSCKEYTTDLRYCLGCLRFRYNRKEIQVETDYAEDFENCILHYLMDGALLKCNWLAPKTKNYSEGGCDGDGRNYESEREAKEYLSEKYHTLCSLWTRKNGRFDLRLKDKRSNPLVYVINAYPDRRSKYDHRYKMFKAYWWEDIVEGEGGIMNNYHFRHNCNMDLRKKIIACSESHKELLKRIVKEKTNNVIILEDDALLDFDRLGELRRMKEFCYLGGQLNTLKVSEYGKLDKDKIRSEFTEGNIQTIDTEKHRIVHNMAYYIPKWEIAQEILSAMPKWEKSRAIDAEFFQLQQSLLIKRFVYPAMATLYLPDAKNGFTYNESSGYKLEDNQLHY